MPIFSDNYSSKIITAEHYRSLLIYLKAQSTSDEKLSTNINGLLAESLKVENGNIVDLTALYQGEDSIESRMNDRELQIKTMHTYMADYEACKMVEDPPMFGAMTHLVSTKYSCYYEYSLSLIANILLDRWILLDQLRKIYYTLSYGNKMSYKLKLEKNSICLGANLKSLGNQRPDLFGENDSGCRKITVFHFIKMVKFFQERFPDDADLQKSLQESLNCFTPLLDTNEYFLDLSELYGNN